MRHNDISPDGDRGHWAVAPSSDGVNMLVQIGEIEERRQTRLHVSVGVALHMAGDLLAGADCANRTGTVHIGEYDATWFIECRAGVCTLTLNDAKRNADAQATLAMPADAMRDMAVGIVRTAHGMLGA